MKVYRFIYELGLRRQNSNQDLYIKGMTSFIYDHGKVICTQPPFINVQVDNEGEIYRVADLWWQRFIGRFRKFIKNKVILHEVNMRFVGAEELEGGQVSSGDEEQNSE